MQLFLFIMLSASFVYAQNVEVPQTISGLPIKPGDSIEKVKAALVTDLEPEPFDKNANQKNLKQLRLKTKGIWVFFNQFGDVETIRLDAPFPGNIGGVGIGNTRASLEEKLGKPTRTIDNMRTDSESKPYLYNLSKDMRVRIDFDRDDEIERFFVFK